MNNAVHLTGMQDGSTIEQTCVPDWAALECQLISALQYVRRVQGKEPLRTKRRGRAKGSNERHHSG